MRATAKAVTHKDYLKSQENKPIGSLNKLNSERLS